MEKITKIGKKEVTLKTTGGTLLRYKMQFGKGLLTEIIKMLATNFSVVKFDV